MFHESIHLYHDKTGIFTGARADEGVGYAAEIMATLPTNALRLLELEILHKNNPSEKTAKGRWEIALDSMNDVVDRGTGEYESLGIRRSFNITEQDVENVWRSLRFKISCQTLADQYNKDTKYLRQEKKFCLKFVCDPNVDTEDGVPTAKPKKQLYRVFK